MNKFKEVKGIPQECGSSDTFPNDLPGFIPVKTSRIRNQLNSRNKTYSNTSVQLAFSETQESSRQLQEPFDKRTNRLSSHHGELWLHLSKERDSFRRCIKTRYSLPQINDLFDLLHQNLPKDRLSSTLSP